MLCMYFKVEITSLKADGRDQNCVTASSPLILAVNPSTFCYFTDHCEVSVSVFSIIAIVLK